MREYDLFVVGAGPGGYTAAILGAKKGLKVGIADPDPPGGVCTHQGCIPFKYLRYISKLYKNSNKYGNFTLDEKQVSKRLKDIIETLSNGLVKIFSSLKIDYYKEKAKIEKDTLFLESGSFIKTKNIVLATGTEAYIPNIFLEHPEITTSLLDIESIKNNKSFLIVGGGVSGIEAAFILNSLGKDVYIVEPMKNILESAPSSLRKRLISNIKKKKIKLYTSSYVMNINGNEVALQNQERIKVDKAIVLAGRIPNSKAASEYIVKTYGQFIKTDRMHRTTVDNVFAIGDVAGTPYLAYKSQREAEEVIELITEDKKPQKTIYPFYVFSQPEIAWVGKTEDSLKNEKEEYITIRFPYRVIGRTLLDDNEEGILNIFITKDKKKILGAEIYGEYASEIAGLMALFIEKEIEPKDIALHLNGHPVYYELIKEAFSSAFNLSPYII